jgi:DNA-binding transcriptional LysR family regulator
MHVSQPSLSQQVKVLETELGGELLERLPDGIRLTPAGKEFLPHARTAVAAAGRAVRAARAALEMRSGVLEIATVRSIAAGVLPELIDAWHERFPGTSVRLREFDGRRLAEEAVAAGEADIGIGPPPADWRGPVRHLGWEELVVVLPEGDAEDPGETTSLVPVGAVPADLQDRILRCIPAVGRELSVYARATLSPQAAAFVALLEEAEWSQPPAEAVLVA